MQTQIGKWGNSLAVRIPGAYAKDLGLREGLKLDISLLRGGLFFRLVSKEYSLKELVAGITPQNVHEEMDWGEAVGREGW